MKTKNVVTLVVMAHLLFSVPALFCDGAALTTQANYANVLEAKQGSLVSIREDADEIALGLTRRVKISDQRVRRLDLTGQNLMEIMPPASRINLEPSRMSCTVSPQSNSEIIKSRLENIQKTEE